MPITLNALRAQREALSDEAVERSGLGNFTPIETSFEADPGAAIGSIVQAIEQYGPGLAALANQSQADSTRQNFELAREQIPQFADLLGGLRSQELDQAFADTARIAPQLQGIRTAAADPAAEALRQLLLSTANEQLAAGTSLTDRELRDVQQNVRSSQQARGLGGGTSSANREAVVASLEGFNRQQQRIAQAQSILGQEQAASPNPFQTILNRPSQVVPQAQAQFGFAQQTAPNAAALGLQAANTGLNLTAQESNNFFNSLAQQRQNQAIQLSGAQFLDQGGDPNLIGNIFSATQF